MAAAEMRHTKGILKNTTSFDKDASNIPERPEKEMKWDEMNILATYHPADKDYGHQKITDPPTPFSRLTEEEKSGDEGELIDSQVLSERLQKKSKAKIIAHMERSEEDDDDDDEEDHLTAQEREKKLEFEKKRKLHYNEFQAVRLRQQMNSDDGDEDDNDNGVSEDGSKPREIAEDDTEKMSDSGEGMMDSTETMDSSITVTTAKAE